MRKPELPALTGIRFYAALFVFFSHVPIMPGMGAIAGDRVVFNAGVVGVSFFFVLSGFILTYNYGEVFRDGVSSDEYKRFAWDRLAKIYPVHLATLLMVAPVAILSPGNPFDWRAVPFHLLLLQCFFPSATPPFYDYLNVPSWSISCEWFFYLLAPLAMYAVLGSVRRRLLIVTAVAAYAGGLGWSLWTGSDVSRLHMVSWFAPSRFVEFLVGMFLARVFLHASGGISGVTAGLAQLAGILLIVVGAMLRRYAPWPLWGGLLYVPGSALLVLSLAGGRGFLAAHLSRPWLCRLGTASFSFYLVHAPLLRIAKNICSRIFGWEVQSWSGFWGVTLGMFVIVQASAFILCYGYEIPLQKHLRGLLRLPHPPASTGMVSAMRAKA